MEQGFPLTVKKYMQNMLIPVNSAKMDADRPLLFVSRNTNGKHAAPIMDGRMINME